MHTENLRKDILQFNLDHMNRIGIPQDPESTDYQPMQQTGYRREFIRLLRSYCDNTCLGNST